MSEVVNLAVAIAERAAATPNQRAVVYPAGRDAAGRVSYTHLTFAQLNGLVDAYARGCRRQGITPGMRTVLMVRPSLEFLPLIYALFKIGAIPVLIDPGMGWKKLFGCVASVAPEAFVGVSLAHVLRLLRPASFRSVRINVTIGRRWGWGGATLADLVDPTDTSEVVATTTAADPAAIIFTTGSTGPPKGVVYTHGMFAAQVRVLGELFAIDRHEVDMPGLALFAMFSLPLGPTVVIPDMDPTKPARVEPPKIVEAVRNQGVTFGFGSPAMWNRISLYCCEHGVRLESLRRVIMAGAPIPAYLHERLLHHILPEGGEVYTPYGATEALPVTCFAGSQVLAETAALTRRGHGYCVGPAVPGVTVRVIAIDDGVIERWADVTELPTGKRGEIVVQGPIVSRAYFQLPERTAEHKIYASDDRDHGPFWHRMGDLGYLDEQGRLWVCGRKSHRVETGAATLFTICCEAVFNDHPDVYRSALLGIGPDRYRQTPVIAVEPQPGKFPTGARVDSLRRELLELARANPQTAGIEHILFHRGFPVDIRHNAKIFREQLAPWAAAELGAGTAV